MAVETSITPLLTVRGAARAAEFYERAFGATVVTRHDLPNGQVVAELEVGGAPFAVVDENPAAYNVSPEALGGTSVRISLIVDDPDAVWQRALDAGAKEVFPLADQPYGLRQGRVEDPFGHHWLVSKPL
jgi:PhnB protein